MIQSKRKKKWTTDQRVFCLGKIPWRWPAFESTAPMDVRQWTFQQQDTPRSRYPLSTYVHSVSRLQAPSKIQNLAMKTDVSCSPVNLAHPQRIKTFSSTENHKTHYHWPFLKSQNRKSWRLPCCRRGYWRLWYRDEWYRVRGDKSSLTTSVVRISGRGVLQTRRNSVTRSKRNHRGRIRGKCWGILGRPMNLAPRKKKCETCDHVMGKKDVTEILHDVVVLEVFQEFDFTFERVEHTLFTFLVG